MASFKEVAGALEALLRVVRLHDTQRAIQGGAVFDNAERVLVEARRGIAAPIAWTPFEPATLRAADAALRGNLAPGDGKIDVFVNSRYQVIRTALADGMIYLSIKRHDQAAIRAWRDLQRIKNELVGPECEGMEIFPAESRKLDGANQFHLWVSADPQRRLTGDGPRIVEAPRPEDRHGQDPFEDADPYGPEQPA